MRYIHPYEPIEFEVPHHWLAASGALGFVAPQASFLALSDEAWPTSMVPVSKIKAPRRSQGIVELHEVRAISILKAMVERVPLPPIEVHMLPTSVDSCFSVRDGYHRYFLALALGFSVLPVSERPFFDFQ